MRDCPHCAEPIQDEAIYCKHCHQDVEPPLWINSMRRCPHCAEWIDLENANCQYCGQHVGVVDLEEGSDFVERLLREDDSQPPSQWSEELPAQPDPGEQGSVKTSPFIEGEPSDLGSSSASLGEASADFDFEQHFSDLDRANADPDRSTVENEPAEFDSEQDFGNEKPLDFGQRRSYADDEPSDLDQDRSFADEKPSGFGRARAGERPDFNQDLRRSLIEPDPETEPEEEPEYELPSQRPPPRYEPEPSPPPTPEPASSYTFQRQQPESDFVSPPASEPDYEAQSSIWAADVQDARSLRSDQPAPAVERERPRLPTGALQGLAALVLIGGLGYGLVALARGPAGEMLAASLATDFPTETPIPQPTATPRSAPTLPPETQGAVDPTAVGSTETGECRQWDQITLEDEGTELCAYGVIRRWFAVAEVPFVAIFSEESGTFAIVDRTTTHPVGPGDCIVARGTVEVMSRTRPDIDLNGTLELCPEQWQIEG